VVKALAAALGLAALSGAVTAATQAGQWISGRHAEREYRLYVPSTVGGRPAPLVVMLHGCTQTPDTFARSTGMNAHAEREKFLVLYPAQKLSANPTRCWNWFLPGNQQRGSGEPAAIVALIDQVAREHAVDRMRVYAAGLSAGASMSAILAACYPDVFAAAAIHSGTMFKSATSLREAQKVMSVAEAPDPDSLGAEAWACGGKRALAMPVMVWQGLGDKVVHRANAELIVRQFSALNDLADDGQSNGSASPSQRKQFGQVDGGHRYTVVIHGARERPVVEHYQVERMGHAWSGGKDDLLFSDGKGPDASLLTWNFFKQFSRN
jgi:poly(hydroxyalkanoate) depolymerase family esterase